MAPLTSLKAETDKKARAILSFASSVQQRVSHNSPDPTLTSELQSAICTLPLKVRDTRSTEFDKEGTELWNLSTRMSRSNSTHDKKTICLLRVFAFNVLDSAHRSQKNKTSANCVRLFKVALKAVKHCLDTEELEQGVKVLERAASYIDELSSPNTQLTLEDVPTRERLQAEYFVLRTSLAWKQSKLDVAEHMYQKIEKALIIFDPASTEELADVLYEIGRDLYGKKMYELSMRWLERALDVISEHDREVLSDDAAELRLSVMQLLAKTSFSLRSTDGLQKASRIINLMDLDYADKMVVSLLKLEFLSSQKEPSPEEFFNVLIGMFRTVPLTRPNFKTIMHHLHKLRKLHTDLACRALDELLSLRLFAEQKSDWTERAAVMRIWIATSSDDPKELVGALFDVLDNISANTTTVFSAAATHAAQTLLWKQIDSAFTEKHYELAESYCRLSVHSIFERCGDLNRAKIVRKMMLCALSRQDISIAKEGYQKMPESQRDSPQTRYLLYKIGLLSGDADLTTESLDIVCKYSMKDATLLYACVLQAQTSGNKMQAVAALQRVLLRYDYNAPKGVHLPALLRCTARLIKGELRTDTSFSDDSMEGLCKVFESAAEYAKKSKRHPVADCTQEFTVTEIDWFSRNSYNMALEMCSTMHPTHLTRLCKSCIQFIELLQTNTPVDDKDNLPLRHICSEFLAVCAFVVLARSEDDVQVSSQHYLSIRHHSTSLRTLAESYIQESTCISEETRVDLIAKYFECVKYELEAVLRLEQWEDIDHLFQESWRYEDPNVWATLADLALVINEEVAKAGLSTTYQAKILAFIQRVINRSWKSTTNTTSLARWIRCLFQLSLSADEKISLHCVDQAIIIAEKWKDTQKPFPTVELEWLSTTSYNRAVDFYSASDDDNCRIWAERALTLAGAASDGGYLKKMLQEKYSGLSWDAS